MISALAYADEQGEKELMVSTMRRLAARLTEERWQISACHTAGEANRLLASAPLLDLICCNVSKEEAMLWLEHCREDYRNAKVMIIADEGMSPRQYLRPRIMASSLLLSPYQPDQMAEVMKEFILSYLEAGADDSSCLVIKSREDRVVIPYDRIYYLEAREKKVLVRLLREEYMFYDTLERIGQELPDGFYRTHRSFIVNSRMIEKVRPSEHMILLREGFTVPLSRSYRASLKEFYT